MITKIDLLIELISKHEGLLELFRGELQRMITEREKEEKRNEKTQTKKD